MYRPQQGRDCTLAGQAYAALREKIISAAYLPGQFLQEARLCDDLGLGRTPVRQALQRLQQDGLIELIHRKGVVVKSDSLSELLLALEARILVEPYCASRCAERASDDQVEALAGLQQDYESKRQAGDRRGLMDIDSKIHALIGEIAGNHLLMELLRPIHERMSRLWFLPHWQLNDFSHTASEHDGLIRAIRNHQPDQASEAMRHHLCTLKDRITLGGIEAGGTVFGKDRD